MARSRTMILAGDVGGTHTRLAFFEQRGAGLEMVSEQVYPSQGHASLDDIVAEFIAAQNLRPERASIGVAGPVRDGISHATNLPWVVDGPRLAKRIGVPSLTLINDLAANAYGIATLSPKDFCILQKGDPAARGNGVVVSPGTGLGEAGLFWDGTGHRPVPSEGGHASFAPTTELQDGLLKHLRAKHGHVSWERVLSGPGLVNIYEFLRDTGRGEEPAWLAAEWKKQDPSALISKSAMQGNCALCEKSLALFVEMLGSEVGNMALKVLAIGGVYVGGGIAPKILAKLQSPEFLTAFLDKGRLRPVLEAMPVRVILNDGTALRGAARRATLQG